MTDYAVPPGGRPPVPPPGSGTPTAPIVPPTDVPPTDVPPTNIPSADAPPATEEGGVSSGTGIAVGLAIVAVAGLLFWAATWPRRP